MNRWSAAVSACLIALGVAACGGDDDDGAVFADASPKPDSGPVIDAGLDQPDALIPTDAPMNERGPLIEVLSPDPSSDFASDSIVTVARFTGRCLAQTNPITGASVDQSTVRMTAIVGSAAQSVPAAPTSAIGEYTASFDLVAFPNGELTIRCTASDTGSPVETNSAAIATYLDLGPAVTTFNPVADGAYAGTVPIEFRVEAAPVASGDTGSAVGVVRAFIGSSEVTLTQTGTLYTANVAFDDVIFPAPLDGPQALLIQASNTRSTDPTTRFKTVVWLADNDGPSISIDAPGEGELVSGLLTINVTVTDPSGVDSSSVIATIAHLFDIDLVASGPSKYTGLFDTRLLDLDTWVFPTLQVRASDAVGNESAVGQSVALDNRGPMFDLDPPELREVTYSAELDAYFCSRLFDPVGDDATSDGEAVAQLSEMRVRAIDRGNGALSVSDVILPTADLDPSSVQMYILDDDSVPLLVDTNGDGQCDDINPVVVPAIVPMTSTEARVIDLFGINDTGSSHFAPPLVPYGSTPEVADGSCSEPPDSDPPLNLCISVELSRVIKNELLEEPAIYGIPPSSPLACLGNAFDSQASNISDGWACIAVIGEDKLGNRGVSAPLRVCFDHDGDGAECHALGTIEPDELLLPSCRSACTLPDRFADFPELNAIRIDL